MPEAPPVTIGDEAREVVCVMMVAGPSDQADDDVLALAAEALDLELDDVARREVGESARERDALGVPVRMRSPGSSDEHWLSSWTMRSMPKIRSLVRESWRGSPLTKLLQAHVVGVDLVGR